MTNNKPEHDEDDLVIKAKLVRDVIDLINLFEENGITSKRGPKIIASLEALTHARSRPEPAGGFDLESALNEKEKREEHGRELGFTDGAKWMFDSLSQPRAQTSDGEFERETGDGEESPISAKDQTEIEFHRDQVMEKMVYIHKLERELAELKARMVLTEEIVEAAKDLDWCGNGKGLYCVEDKKSARVMKAVFALKRITSSRGNE